MANTNIKTPRAPKQPKQKAVSAPVVEEPKVQIPENTEEVLNTETTVITSIPDVPAKKETEPETVDLKQNGTQTTIYLLRTGDKYNVYRGIKKLSRIAVGFDKAKCIASAYGENNPTVR